MFYSLYHFKFVPFAIVRSICCIISSSPLFAVSFQVLCTHCIQSMSSRCFVHCCDPLKSNTRKRIFGGGSHSLRPIPNCLIIKFPSLHLTQFAVYAVKNCIRWHPKICRQLQVLAMVLKKKLIYPNALGMQVKRWHRWIFVAKTTKMTKRMLAKVYSSIDCKPVEH